MNHMLEILPLSAFKDNYIWILINHKLKACAIVDPGEAEPVLEFLHEHPYTLKAVLITHHHWDHVSGVEDLCAGNELTVYGPANSAIPRLDVPLAEGDNVVIEDIDIEFKVAHIPGHTLDHIAYYNDEQLFCGDTLFSAGCGRLFEGSADQMANSLARLAALPESTQVYCGHEYTINNLEFAKAVEPENLAIAERLEICHLLRDSGKPTLPSTIEIERATNPFIRLNEPSILQMASKQVNREISDPVQALSIIRQWKDRW